MKIDFTQFENPIEGLTLSEWKQISKREISPEEVANAAEVGIILDELDHQYQIGKSKVDFQLTPEHSIVFDAASLVADVRSNKSLRSIGMRSISAGPSEIYELAKPIVQSWKLHCFEESEEAARGEAEPVKIDAIAELKKWRDNPEEDVLPSFLAQTDPNIYPGIWFFRLVINQDPKKDSHFIMSAQVFWRDKEFDQENLNMNEDKTFWKRADKVIELANDQSSDEPISQVAKSLLFAAARFNAFDYWTCFEDPESFNESRDEAIEEYVSRFKEMLKENFDDHLDRFEESVDT